MYGCVNLNGEQLAEYAALNWSVPADPEDVMVIHTLCISPGGLGEEGHGVCGLLREEGGPGREKGDAPGHL